MANLQEDLKQYADELFTKKDLKAGLKLVKEIAGLTTVAMFAFEAVVNFFPVVSLPTTPLRIAVYMKLAAESYAKLSTEERRQLRAVISWIRGGFNLGKKLLQCE